MILFFSFQCLSTVHRFLKSRGQLNKAKAYLIHPHTFISSLLVYVQNTTLKSVKDTIKGIGGSSLIFTS